MKKINTAFFIFVCFVYSVNAQQTGFTYSTTTIQVPLAGVVDASAGSQDFDPKLLLLKPSFPMPVSDIKLKKSALDQSRNNFVSNNKNQTAFQKTAAATPILSTNFIANYTSGTPNDNDMAISNGGKIVSVTNSSLYFYNDSGLALAPAQRSLSFFANKLGTLNRTYDPRVIYDPKKDRFIVVFLQGSDHFDTRIIIAFSKTNDPTKLWIFYSLPGNITSGDSSWSDYPIVSLTDDELFITVNRVKDNTPWQVGFIESYIWQVDKQKGYDSSAVLSFKNYNNIKYNGKPIWNICPVKGGLTTHTPNMYFVSVRPSDLQNDTVFLHEITNTNASGNAQLTLKTLRTDRTYGLMPNAIQPSGKKLQTNDARILSACIENNIIHYVANTIDTAKFSPSVYYGRITDPNITTPSIHGNIISSDTLDFGYPSITYVGGGADDQSVMLTYSYVSPTQFPGTAATYIDRSGNLSPMVIVKKGETNITVLTDSVERWGDYTGIQRKYNEPAFSWLCGSFGWSNGNRTWIAKLKNTDTKLGVNEISKQVTNATLFPNPASNYASINFDLNEQLMLQFEVMDITGKVIGTLLRDLGKAGTNRFTFRVTDLNEGIYFLTIKHENTIIQSKKFIVTR
jgi:Secretion system C-terminal sorting domain